MMIVLIIKSKIISTTAHNKVASHTHFCCNNIYVKEIKIIKFDIGKYILSYMRDGGWVMDFATFL